MVENANTEPGALTRDGLIKIQEVADGKQPLTDAALIGNAQQSLHSQVAKLAALGADDVQWDAAHAFEVGEFRCVHAPRSVDETDLSGVTVFYGRDKTHVHTAEVVLSQPSDGLHQLQVWDNGKLVADETFNENAPQVQWSWQVLNDCLASQGISWALISVIGVACSAACVGTAGTACVPCIAGLSGANTFVIGYCVGRAIRS